MDEGGPRRMRHLHRHKAQDRKLEGGGDKKKRGPQTVKADPLISRFCRHSETEQKNIHLVCTLKLLGQTRWQTEGDWEGEIARQGGEVQPGWFAYNIRLFEWREDSFFFFFFLSYCVAPELLSKFALKLWLLRRAERHSRGSEGEGLTLLLHIKSHRS